jgi:hypothetical protein
MLHHLDQPIGQLTEPTNTARADMTQHEPIDPA